MFGSGGGKCGMKKFCWFCIIVLVVCDVVKNVWIWLMLLNSVNLNVVGIVGKNVGW